MFIISLLIYMYLLHYKSLIHLKKGGQTKSYKVKYKSEDKLDERRQNPLDKRAQLTGEVTAALKDISHLENDLGRLEQEILDTGQ